MGTRIATDPGHGSLDSSVRVQQCLARRSSNPAVRHFQRAEQFFHNLFDEAQVLTEPWLVFFLGIADLGLSSVRGH